MDKRKLLVRLYGRKALEPYRLDSMLEAFDDGLSRNLDQVRGGAPIAIQNDSDRVISCLVDDGMLKESHSMLTITSKGKLHLSKGGYMAEFMAVKKSSLSFWVSGIAMILSIAATIISFIR